MSKRKKQPTKKPIVPENLSLVEFSEYIREHNPRNYDTTLQNYVVSNPDDIDDSIPIINAVQQNLTIRDSTVARAGSGLFTRRAYNADEEITRYGGTLINNRDIEFVDGLDRYIVEVPLRMGEDTAIVYMDCRTHFKLGLELGRWINDSRDNPNCYFRSEVDNEEQLVLVVRALRPIDAGEELFLNYGDNYWKQEELQELQELQECIACGIANISILCRECGGPMCTRCSDEIHK